MITEAGEKTSVKEVEREMDSAGGRVLALRGEEKRDCGEESENQRGREGGKERGEGRGGERRGEERRDRLQPPLRKELEAQSGPSLCPGGAKSEPLDS